MDWKLVLGKEVGLLDRGRKSISGAVACREVTTAGRIKEKK